MTGKFTEIDQRRCLYYARFMSGLSLPQANGVYWSLFMFVLFLMCVCANLHHKSINLSIEVKNKRDESRTRRVRKRFLGFVSICFLVSAACAVFEVFALLNIEFCDGEDLIFLYWSFWGFLQVGSIIAIFGVILNLWISISDVHTPSWAVALGTPVLVFAALHWILQAIWRRTWLKFTDRDIEGKNSDEIDEEEGSIEEEDRRDLDCEEKKEIYRWTSRAPTIAPQLTGQLIMPINTRRSSI